MYEIEMRLCCDSCERKEAVHCSGCLNMEKPFWGSLCGVKACCEEKKTQSLRGMHRVSL